MLPVPELPRPMAVLELDHTKEAPGGVQTKEGIIICSPGQTESLATGDRAGVGLMVTEKLMEGPTQSLRVGVTVIVPEIGAPVLLIGAIQDGILPEPEAPSPIAVFELDHEKEAPVGKQEKTGITIVAPGQTEIFDSCEIIGVGLIVMVKETGVPGQPSRVGVTVMVPETGAPVLFAGAVHAAILPDPEVPSPIAVLELDQEKEAPAGLLENGGMTIISPGQTESPGTGNAAGVGLIETVKLKPGPGQPLSVGVTVMVPEI
jgi:hypothetical protein